MDGVTIFLSTTREENIMTSITYVKAINRKIEEYKFENGKVFHKLTNIKTGNVQKDWTEVTTPTVINLYGSIEKYWEFLVGWAKQHPKHSVA